MSKPKNRPPRAPRGTMARILRYLYRSYPVLVPLTAVCILLVVYEF